MRQQSPSWPRISASAADDRPDAPGVSIDGAALPWRGGLIRIRATRRCNLPPPAYLIGVNELSPIVSEFDSEEAAEEYDRWFRAKVAASLNDGLPVVAHDDAMAQVRGIIAKQGLVARVV